MMIFRIFGVYQDVIFSQHYGLDLLGQLDSYSMSPCQIQGKFENYIQ